MLPQFQSSSPVLRPKHYSQFQLPSDPDRRACQKAHHSANQLRVPRPRTPSDTCVSSKVSPHPPCPALPRRAPPCPLRPRPAWRGTPGGGEGRLCWRGLYSQQPRPRSPWPAGACCLFPEAAALLACPPWQRARERMSPGPRTPRGPRRRETPNVLESSLGAGTSFLSFTALPPPSLGTAFNPEGHLFYGRALQVTQRQSHPIISPFPRLRSLCPFYR